MSITWNGVSSDTIGVIVERIPNRYVPTRRFSPQQVAGRNGNILLVDKSFPNVEQEYEVYLSAEAQGLPSVARACAEWLMGPDGYCRLEDSYDTTVYREAFLMGGYDLENILNKFGRCTITFSCKPQKYLLTGDTPIEISAGTTTYTGDAVQFDGVTGASITSLSTTITPTQDLHGYANPWPGGGGANMLDYSTASVSDNSVSFGGGISLAANQAYTFSYYGTSNVVIIAYVHGTSTRLFTTGYLKTYTFTPTEDVVADITYYNSTGITSAENLFQAEKGSISHDWTPYSNICPISGRTGLSVYVSPTQDQQDATTYAVDWTSQAGTVYGGTLDVVTGVLTVTSVKEPLRGSYFSSYSSSISCVYGGKPSGWSAWAQKVGGSGVLMTDGVASSRNDIGDVQNGFFIGDTTGGNQNLLFVKLNGITTDLTTAQNYIETRYTNSNPIEVVYTLATPLTYQLTAQEIEVLVGENNVWSSSGPVSATVVTPLGGIVTNPTPFEARPMLEVSGVGEITINGKSIQILESVSDFQIDCEAMEAEDNSKIYCMDFPELSGGENEIVGDGSITALTVTPRWWTL